MIPVFDIIRGSIHDGPGIRTVVFLQGCPLRCVWCHNPESQSLHSEKGITHYSTDELFELLCRDRSYYEVSGGGITFSGGEALLHMEALKPLVQKLNKKNINIAFDTCGFFDYKKFESNLLPLTQTILFDLKLSQLQSHREYTGKSNEVILRNLEALAQTSVEIIIRIPLIPGITATEKNLLGLARIMNRLDLDLFEMVPYNPSCIEKLQKLGRETHSKLSPLPMTREEEIRCREIFIKTLEGQTQQLKTIGVS
jgi:pyruvate formate lyase activating enzyme